MKSSKYLLSVLVFCVFFAVPGSFADIVVFKSGKELMVEKTWQEGDQVYLLFHGLKAGIPKSKIARIESESSDSKRSTPVRTGHGAQTGATSSAGDLSSEACTTLRKDGFCNLQWGTRVSSVNGLKKTRLTVFFL